MNSESPNTSQYVLAFSVKQEQTFLNDLWKNKYKERQTSQLDNNNTFNDLHGVESKKKYIFFPLPQSAIAAEVEEVTSFHFQ